jgi:hypothetical protein
MLKKRLSARYFTELTMRIKIITAVAFLAFASVSYPACALESVSLSRTGAGIITVKAENSPLNGLVQELARKCGFDLKAPSLGSEGVYLDLTGSSLEDVLKKLLRGYNYVLIKEDGSGKGSLFVFGKVQRVEISYPPPSAAPAPPGDTPVPSQSTGEAAASPAEQGFVDPGGGSPRSPGANQRLGEASPSLSPAGAGGGSSRTTTQSTSPSGGTPASTTLTPPVPPQIAGLEPPPTIPSALLSGGAASQGGSASAGSGAAAAGTGSASTSGGSSGIGSGSSGASGGNTPPAPPGMPPMPPSMPGL